MGSCHFCSKILSGGEQGHLQITHHETGKNAESSKTRSLKPNTASHNNAIWYTDTDGFLEHSPSGESLYYKWPALQKIIPGGVIIEVLFFCFSYLGLEST